MSRPRHASRTSAIILTVAGFILQAPSAAGQGPAAPPEFPLTSDVGSRLAEAAQDPTLAPWQREFMLEVAQGRPERAAVEPSPALPGPGLASAGSAAEDGAWSVLFPPSARSGHTAFYDPVRDRVVVFGGYDGSSDHNDVWALSLAGSPAWSALAAAGTPPSGRSGHTAIYDPVRDRMVVFGGYDGSFRNDVWALSLAGSPAWSALAPAGSPPSGRVYHTAIYDPVRDRIVVFGGEDGSIFLNDVWALSLAGSPAWSALAPAGGPPTGRYLHTAIYDPVRDRMVVFGGLDGSRANDVWALSLAGSPVWSALAPAGSLPSARYGHTSTYDPVRDRMVVFGGSDDNSLVNDLWSLSFAGGPAWSALAPAGSRPSARYLHIAVFDPVGDRMVVFGGGADGGSRNDVWALSLAGGPAWSALVSAGSPPSPRHGHTAVYDPVRDRMVVFGGRDGDGIRNDAWSLSLAGSPAWSELPASGSRPPARFYHAAIYDPVRDRMLVFGGSGVFFSNDTWALSLAGSPAWSAIATAGIPPLGRYGPSAIYDPVGDRMIVFGGAIGSPRSDVWALSLSGEPTWSEIIPAGDPPASRVNHTAIYDPRRERMVVFGGNDYVQGPYYRNDAWALSLAGSPAWSDLAPTATPPMARFLHAAIYDPVRDRMVVFGGSAYAGSEHYLNDAWELSLSGSHSWSVLTPAGSPPIGRYAPTTIYDPVRDRMVVFGGSAYFGRRDDVWALTWGSAPVPVLVSLAHAAAEPDIVSLAWYGSESAGLTASVERREATTGWQRLGTISADGTGTFRYDDRAVTPGARYAYRLAYLDDAGAETVTAETWVDVPVTVSLALDGLRPNPAGAELVAVFALPDDAPAALAVLDVTGRRVLAREVGSLGAGRHTLRLGHPSELPAGIYWLRLERMGRSLLAKAIVLR